MGKAPFLERFARIPLTGRLRFIIAAVIWIRGSVFTHRVSGHGSCHRFGSGHCIADRDAFKSRRGGGVLLLPWASCPISAGRSLQFFLRMSCLPLFAPFVHCPSHSRFQTLPATGGTSLEQPR